MTSLRQRMIDMLNAAYRSACRGEENAEWDFGWLELKQLEGIVQRLPRQSDSAF